MLTAPTDAIPLTSGQLATLAQEIGRAHGGRRARVSQDRPDQNLFGGLLNFSLPDEDADWRTLDLDRQPLGKQSVSDLVERLASLSPDLSKALWDFLRFTNPGYECHALRQESEEVDNRADALLQEFMRLLQRRHGSCDVVFGRLFITAFLRGGFFAELVLDNAGRVPLELATPDPRFLHFEKTPDDDMGFVWRPFQYQQGKKVYLDRETIAYVPVDPLPAQPTGRALAVPAVFPLLFGLSILHDMRRVVSQQGYPRLDIAISMERLRASMPPNIAGDPMQWKAWIESIVREVAQSYSILEPDDAYVHTDVTTVNRPVGTVDSSSLGAIDGIITMLDRQAIRALKTMPLLFGNNESTTETHANRQWEIHVAGIKALQHLCEGLLERLLTLALQVQGVQSRVKFRFAELRAAELLRDAQVVNQNLRNAALAYALGYVSQDAAAGMALGRAEADQAAPRIAGAGIQAAGGTADGAASPGNSDAGALRQIDTLQPWSCRVEGDQTQLTFSRNGYMASGSSPVGDTVELPS